MKPLISIFFCICTFICNGQNTKVEVIREFVNEIELFNKVKFDLYLPIKSFNEVANHKADSVIVLSKANIKKALLLAKKFQVVFVTVEDHTIVKITNFKKTSPSGSWSARMPFGKGYVQKLGRLNVKSDNIKYIIGKPEGVKQVMYLFYKKRRIAKK